MADASAQEQISQEALRQTGEKPDSKRGKLVAQRMRDLRREHGAEAVLRRNSQERGVSTKRRAEFLLQMDGGRRVAAGNTIDNHTVLLEGRYSTLSDVDKQAWHGVIQHGLETSRMGDLFTGPPPPTPEQMKQRSEGLLNDPEFMVVYQEQMDNIVNSRADFSSLSDRVAFLRADDPATYPDDATAEAAARTQILNEWRDEQDRRLGTIMSTSVDAYTTKKVEQAQQASSEGTNLVVNAKIAEQEKLWHAKGNVGKEAVKQDFDAFMRGGGEEVLGKKTWESMSEEERADFNTRFGEKMFTERLLAGKLAKDDMRTLATAEWLGADFPSRVDRIQDMFEANDSLKELIANGQANGTIDKNLWDKIKAAGPAGLAGGILALLAALFMPASIVPSVIGYGLIAGGGAGALGLAKHGVDEMKAA